MSNIDESQWHSWFAWHPVQFNDPFIGKLTVWFETIERRRETWFHPFMYRLKDFYEGTI